MNDKSNVERLDYFKKVQNQTPDDYRHNFTNTILEGKITLGMTPYEAHLAGGQFSYQVTADKEVWPSGTDPMRIMWIQTFKPDNSEISMTFTNKTQYNSMDAIIFNASFTKGPLC